MWSPLRANRVFIAVMAAGTDCARIEAVARTVAAKAGYNNLKQELVQAVVEFVRWRDGYGKSLSYGILPRSFSEHRNGPEKTSVALVISPLSTLMLHQKARFVPSGNTAEFLRAIQQNELAVIVLRRRSLAVPKLSGNASCSLRDAYKSTAVFHRSSTD